MVKLAVPGVEQAVCATGCELMDGVVFTVSATLVEVAAAGSSTNLRYSHILQQRPGIGTGQV